MIGMSHPVEQSETLPGQESILRDFLTPMIFRRPNFLAPSPWTPHIPFAFWLMEAHQPRVVAELETRDGVSFLAFCQAAKHLSLQTECVALGPPDESSGAGEFPEQPASDGLGMEMDTVYAGMARISQAPFDEAASAFDAGTVDLLHLNLNQPWDVLDKVMQGWLPKLSDRGIVLIHGINEETDRHGPPALFAEMKGRFPAFAFHHGAGLGVISVSMTPPEWLRRFQAMLSDERIAKMLEDLFGTLGRGWEDGFAARQLSEKNERQDRELAVLARMIIEKDRKISVFEYELASAAKQRQSLWWRITAPVRAVAALFRTADPRDVELAKQERLIARSAYFDPKWYLGKYRDVAAIGLSPVRHYLLLGAVEGRDPSPLFDTRYYLEQNRDVAQSGTNPLVHYLRRGMKENRKPRPD